MSDRRKILDLFYGQKDTWQKRAEAGIEKHRKGDARIILKDKNGDPIKNLKIKLRQISHEFRFGANLFMLDELETSEKNEKYKTAFKELFNMATLPFYWNTLEPERGKPRYEKDSPKVYRRPSPDLCIEFCEKNGIEPREHALAYDHFFPDWLASATVDEVKEELERHFSEISERYADKIPTIEVTNELNWDVGRTSFYDDPDFIKWCFKLAEKYFPGNKLCINEVTGLSWKFRPHTTAQYYSYIEANMLKGARIDAIGMQYHLFNRKENEYENTRMTLNPDQLYRHMDLMSLLKRPLQITEVTVPAYSNEGEDEAIQAEILEYLYTVWFSHPSVEQIIYWNLVDGYAHLWDPDPEKIKASLGNMTLGENYYYGGLLRFDLSKKPAFEKLRELIKERWHTECTCLTDGDGAVSVRGFYGSYELSPDIYEKDIKAVFNISKNGDNTHEIILDI